MTREQSERNVRELENSNQINTFERPTDNMNDQIRLSYQMLMESYDMHKSHVNALNREYYKAKKLEKGFNSFSGSYWFLSMYNLFPFLAGEKSYLSVAHAFICLSIDESTPNYEVIYNNYFNPERPEVRYLAWPQNAMKNYRGKCSSGEIILKRGWNANRQSILERLYYLQATQYEELARLIVGTGDIDLCMNNDEGDEFYGKSTRKRENLDREVITSMVGQNILGKALCNVREMLKRDGFESPDSGILDWTGCGYQRSAQEDIDNTDSFRKVRARGSSRGYIDHEMDYLIW